MKKRVFVLGNPDKPQVSPAMDDLLSWLPNHAEVVGHDLTHESDGMSRADSDYVIVLGGDGTIIGTARSMGTNQKPIIGLNQGKLGFLAAFSLDELRDQIDSVLNDVKLIRERTILDVCIEHEDGSMAFRSLGINDCVIHAGSPYRMIQLAVRVDGQWLTEIRGDGVIIASPSGSTAHNMSAGGPILEPGVQAIVLTPLCPHSLTHRPIVIECASTIEIVANMVNPGTTVSIDGQISSPYRAGDVLTVHRSEENFKLVKNPKYSRWHTLVTKLNWGRPPAYQQ
jgi:NAD+ kinase